MPKQTRLFRRRTHLRQQRFRKITFRPTLNRLAHWNLHHKEWVRLALGGGVIIMGLIILATV
jgi:hypothetical protein